MPAAASAVREIYVEANGLRHHLLARGEPGKPVVFMIHSLAGQAHNFDHAAAKLADDFHVYALDVRGRGESEWGPPEGYTNATYVEDLDAVRQALGLQRFALIGTWMGALISMLYAAAHPEQVTSVVLNDIGPEVKREGSERTQGYLVRTPKAFPDLRAVERYFEEHYGPLMAGLAKPELAEFARWHVRRNDLGVYTWKYDPALRDASDASTVEARWAAFEAISAPVLVMRTQNSDLLAEETAERMREKCQQCMVVEVPASGSAPAILDATTIETIRAFLKEGV